VTPRGRRAGLFVAGLVLVAALPLAGRAWRAGGAPGCALDGIPLREGTRVRVVDAAGRERSFCCIDCASRWLVRSGDRPRGITVTDETTGAPVPAARAWFVRSRVVVLPATGCRIHAFASEADARKHAESFGGLVLEGGERPLGEGKETAR